MDDPMGCVPTDEENRNHNETVLRNVRRAHYVDAAHFPFLFRFHS